MSITQHINIRQAELIERMARFIDVDGKVSFLFKGVYTKHNSEWSLLSGCVKLNTSLVNGDNQECFQEYPEYLFVCRIMDFVPADMLQRLHGEEDIFVPEIEKSKAQNEDINWSESLVPSHISGSKFPIRRYSARLSNNVQCFESKLVAFNLEFHPSAIEYVKKFIGLKHFNGSSDRGELRIDIPDLRGYLDINDKGVRYKSCSKVAMSVVGSIDGEPVNLLPDQDVYLFEKDQPSDIELWLVTDSNEIVDYCSSSEWEYQYGTQTSKRDQSQLLKIIAAGESEHCEFKKYIDLVTKKNSKAYDIEKTVCALSNHQGGRLFIGVDDETCIVGINEGCNRDYKNESEEKNIELYRKSVEKRLQESLKKNQCFKTYLLEQQGLVVLVVEVQKTSGLNYILPKNETFIRRGASSPKMTLSEVQLYPIERDALGRDILF
ncbi:AlbA family DNA-binding domain-containing protein [Saccharophagus degradans]|uniref:ATP-binding protein n=1 Tax=Saccharophagus degradans TaxID=86304 RepID=A0AAW7XBE1_9GAMM|nr:ATP-binding protein [Saccharophagus degradans]MDO6423747.1 ATP-binding protein [Saccharophagus degradans]MDO6607827.1 ATP-binding protein [Saccharophagus degradans]